MNSDKLTQVVKFIIENKLYKKGKNALQIQPQVGFCHFTDGSCFFSPLSGKTVDGLYLRDGYWATNCEKGSLKKAKAESYCSAWGYSLPKGNVRDVMGNYSDCLNAVATQIGWPSFGYSTWASDDDSKEWDEGVYVGGIEPIDIPGHYCDAYKTVRPVCYRGAPIIDLAAILQEAPWDCTKALAEALKVDWNVFLDFYRGKRTLPSGGCYLLKNQDFSEKPVYNQEWGIYLNENDFIYLKMPEGGFCKSELPWVLNGFNIKLPSKEQIELLEQKIPQVDYALSQIGMKDFRVIRDAVETCWYEGLADGNISSLEKRRIFVFGRKANISSDMLLLLNFIKQLGFNL